MVLSVVSLVQRPSTLSIGALVTSIGAMPVAIVIYTVLLLAGICVPGSCRPSGGAQEGERAPFVSERSSHPRHTSHMSDDIGSRVLVTWRDRTGMLLSVFGQVTSWYARDYSWGRVSGAVVQLDKALRARGTRLGSDLALGEQGISPAGQYLLLVAASADSKRADQGPVHVELRTSDPAIDDRPGWWLSRFGDCEVRQPGCGWSSLTWRRVLNGAVFSFALGTVAATVGFGGSARHLDFPGTPTWPEGFAAAVMGGTIALIAVGLTIRALWSPRVRHRAILTLGLMAVAIFFLGTFALFIATYGDPGVP